MFVLLDNIQNATQEILIQISTSRRSDERLQSAIGCIIQSSMLGYTLAVKELHNSEDDQMNKDKDASDLAKEFFTAGNIVVGFYVAQTLIFVNSIPKALEQWKSVFRGNVSRSLVR